MNMEKLISFVVPVYNRPAAIINCIYSLLHLHYQKTEIIVIDDGSTDNTLQVCKSLSLKDTRVKVYTQKNAGVSSARNKGIDLATGDYIAFIDSDDVVLPDYLDDVMDDNIGSFDTYMFGRGNVEIRKGMMKYRLSPKKVPICKCYGKEKIFEFLYARNNPYVNPVFFCTDKLFSLNIIKHYHIYFDLSVDLGEDQIFVMTYLLHSEHFYYNSNRRYCGVSSSEPIAHLSQKIRTPEQHYHNIIENFNSLIAAYYATKIEALLKYSYDYLLDRPITKIFRQYCVSPQTGGVDEHVANFLNSTVKDLYKNNADKIKFVTNRKVQDIAYLFLNTNAACALNLSKKMIERSSMLARVKSVVLRVLHKTKSLLTYRNEVIKLY